MKRRETSTATPLSYEAQGNFNSNAALLLPYLEMCRIASSLSPRSFEAASGLNTSCHSRAVIVQDPDPRSIDPDPDPRSGSGSGSVIFMLGGSGSGSGSVIFMLSGSGSGSDLNF